MCECDTTANTFMILQCNVRVARFLAAKYGRLLSIRDVHQGQYLRLLLYYALTRSLQLSTFYNTVVSIFIHSYSFNVQVVRAHVSMLSISVARESTLLAGMTR